MAVSLAGGAYLLPDADHFCVVEGSTSSRLQLLHGGKPKPARARHPFP